MQVAPRDYGVLFEKKVCSFQGQPQPSCPRGHYKCSLAWHCTLVLYIARLLNSHGEIPVCTLATKRENVHYVLVGFSPNAANFLSSTFHNIRIIPEYLHSYPPPSLASSFDSSPNVQLRIPELTWWLWSAVIWLFALQPFRKKAKEFFLYWSLKARHPCSLVFGTVLGRNVGFTVRTLDWRIHELHWGAWGAVSLIIQRRDSAPTDEFLTRRNAVSWNNDTQATHYFTTVDIIRKLFDRMEPSLHRHCWPHNAIYIICASMFVCVLENSSEMQLWSNGIAASILFYCKCYNIF